MAKKKEECFKFDEVFESIANLLEVTGKSILDSFEGKDSTEEIKKERKKVIHRDVLKERRDKKEKRDYADKEELYHLMHDFQRTCRRIEECGETEELLSRKKELQDILILSYYRIANKFIKHPNFRGYPESQKQDMINDAVVRAMQIGKEGNVNYGIPYFARFNLDEYNNIFSFFTQQIQNFFLQFLNKQYAHENKKWEVLNKIINQHNINNIRDGVKGYMVGIGDVVNKED